MELTNDVCEISIIPAVTYSLNSPDNRHYDFEYNPENHSQHDFWDAFHIHIDLFIKEYDIVLVGEYTKEVLDHAVLEGNVLTVMMGCEVSQIDITTGEMTLHRRFECFGSTFGIYPIQDGYIIWGELEIIRLNAGLEKCWSFSGRDIFVSNSGKEPFEICENSIKLNDWEDNFYELDFNGRLISG